MWASSCRCLPITMSSCDYTLSYLRATPFISRSKASLSKPLTIAHPAKGHKVNGTQNSHAIKKRAVCLQNTQNNVRIGACKTEGKNKGDNFFRIRIACQTSYD